MSRIDSITQKITNKKCTFHRSSVLKGLQTQQGTPKVISWAVQRRVNLTELCWIRSTLADLMRGPDTSRVLKIRPVQRYKQCLISVMIIELDVGLQRNKKKREREYVSNTSRKPNYTEEFEGRKKTTDK
jgi:hypothetical protein